MTDVLAALAEASGREPVVRFAAARDGDIRHSRAACGRAAEALGFRSAMTFADGLAATWSWYVSRRAQVPAGAADAAASALRAAG